MQKRLLGLGIVVGLCVGQLNAAVNVADQLCSPQGVANLVPAFKGADGRFEVPSPLTDLPRFLQAYDGLRNVIAVALAQAEVNANPAAVGAQTYTRFSFGQNWTASEVGFAAADGTIPDFSKGGFGDYGGPSFLQGVVPVAGTGGAFYTVPGEGVFIAPMPTVLRCVNVIMETSSHDSGTFISPSYALGDKQGHAFMLVNGCQNTSTTLTLKHKTVLTPRPSAYLGIQIATPDFRAAQS